MTDSHTENTQVLIVGGSLVGLTAALCLAAHGVQSIVVERHSGSSLHPRALGYTPRTMEIFRALGFQSKIKESDPDFKLLRARVESLAGKWHETSSWTEDQETINLLDYSISHGAAIAQDELEDILRDQARRRSIDLRYSNTLVSFEQDSSSVNALVRGANGTEYQIHAHYMLAADGNRSMVREQLGIEREGEIDGKGKMAIIRSTLFRAPLDEYLKKGITQFNIDQPDLRGFLVSYQHERWALMFTDGIDRDSDEQLAGIRHAIGRDDVEIEIITSGKWELSMLIADKYGSGRVYLAGDAAHTLPPNRGGYGANTGIADAYNIAWKFAAVLRDESKAQLLDTYETERRPIALLRKQQIQVRSDYKFHANMDAAKGTMLDDVAMELGELYRSGAMMDVDPDLPGARRPEEWGGQPGTRFAHVWLQKGGTRISSLDFFGKDWMLVTENPEWKAAATTVSSSSSINVKTLVLGVDAQPKDPVALQNLMGARGTGALLVRPDGIIAWRHIGKSEDPVEDLKRAIRQVAMPTTC